VIGRHAVAKNAQRPRAFDFRDAARLQLKFSKNGGCWM
jgi:hypothetical protein